MKKYSNCSIAVISFNNTIQTEYSDNGIRATFEKINYKNGLQNVETRIKAITRKNYI
jgi:hypothetical protein